MAQLKIYYICIIGQSLAKEYVHLSYPYTITEIEISKWLCVKWEVQYMLSTYTCTCCLQLSMNKVLNLHGLWCTCKYIKYLMRKKILARFVVVLQITPQSVRLISCDNQKLLKEWKHPGGKNISLASSNTCQVVACVGSELYYLELLQGDIKQVR